MNEIERLRQELRDVTAQLYAEQSVMDDTLDMAGAPQCGDPFMPERITRVLLLAQERDKALEELNFLKLQIASMTAAYKAAGILPLAGDR